MNRAAIGLVSVLVAWGFLVFVGGVAFLLFHVLMYLFPGLSPDELILIAFFILFSAAMLLYGWSGGPK